MPKAASQSEKPGDLFENVECWINVYPLRPDKPRFVIHTNEENAARSRRKDIVCVIHIKGDFKRKEQSLLEAIPF